MEPDRADVRPAGDPTAPHALEFGRRIDLPRRIVWDALVDPVLVSGWLGDADVDPRAGGRFDVRPGAPDGRRPAGLGRGRIARIAPPHELVIETVGGGGETALQVRVALADVPGGPRNRSTALTVTLSSTMPFTRAGETQAAWLTHLDVLQELLHGRPADWDRWPLDWEPVWQANRAGSGRRKDG